MTDEKTADITTIQRVSREMRMAQKVLTGDGPITGCVSAFAPLPVSPDILGSRLCTSYATSVALRDVGAPQEGGDRDWAEQEGTNPMLVKADCFLLPGEVRGPRAFRADEIVEALMMLPETNLGMDSETAIWRVRVITGPVPYFGRVLAETYHESLVEALAAAWLAVLKEGKK